MKKTLSVILAISLMLSAGACATSDVTLEENIIAGSGSIAYSSQSNSISEEIEYVENEDEDENLDEVEVEESGETSSTASSVASSSVASSVASSSTASSVASSSTASSVASSSTASSVASSSTASSVASSSTASSVASSSTSTNTSSGTATAPSGEVRSVWISYLEYLNWMKDKSASQFRAYVRTAFEESANYGLNTVVAQVRPFGDAIYDSAYFPASYLYTGTEGTVGGVPYDALEIMIEEADRLGLRIEAWINPYRVRNDASRGLSSDNPAQLWLNSGSDAVIKFGDTITYNPASTEAQDLIVKGVLEIVNNYDVDGIHFDDYFYPTTDSTFDTASYNAYKNGGGSYSLADWRRNNVTTLIRKVHDAIEAADPSVVFGISPQGNDNNNYDAQYVDIKTIVNAGLIDYLCPQMYFGFDNAACPFASTTKYFNDIVAGTGVDLYVGLATYKFGKIDTWAGAGQYEWQNSTDILARQVDYTRSLSNYGGFILYRYDSAFNPVNVYGSTAPYTQIQTELDNLQDLFN